LVCSSFFSTLFKLAIKTCNLSLPIDYNEFIGNFNACFAYQGIFFVVDIQTSAKYTNIAKKRGH